ncbi:MAG: adenylyltransferase/cytidyltransferase family protein [Vampirovibrionales bacterium]
MMMGLVLHTLEEVLIWVNTQRQAGNRIVTTNGCFDLMHVGHARYLQWSKAQGDVLFVCVNSDASVRQLKGQSRPIVLEQDRMALLASLGCVDAVTCFSEQTPVKLLEAIRPDCHVKGGQYTLETLPEAPALLAMNTQVVFAEMSEGHSTSALIQRVLSAHRSGADSV